MGASANSAANELRTELQRLLKALVVIAVALLAFVLVLRFLPFSESLALIALLTVLGGAVTVAGYFTAHWNRPLLGWVASWAVVPGYVYLVNLVVPREPDALDSLAYVFGTAYGVIAGAVGAIGGLAIARLKGNDT